MARDNESIPKVRIRYGAVVLRKSHIRLDTIPRPHDREDHDHQMTAPQLGQISMTLKAKACFTTVLNMSLDTLIYKNIMHNSKNRFMRALNKGIQL